MPEIASQWNPDRNTFTAADVNGASRREVWWRDPECGHEWRARVVDRDKYQRLRCPDCRTVLDSLAWQFPSLAGEWSVENSLTAWHVRPTGRTAFVPQWVCSTNHQHHWQATLGSRIAGSDCPECREAGKSRVELDHHEAAVALFGSARSGALVRSTLFRARPAWTVDILVEDQASAEQRSLVIEYDGAYWHGPETKRAVDQAKSTDLLEADYFVVRLRESPLPALEVEHPRYLEVEVSSTAPRPHATITLVQEWFSAFSTNAPSET